MKLSIITVNYRSWGHLENMLGGLRDGFPDDWEIIVVDNESIPQDFDAFAARHPGVAFIANPENSGFGAGCNIGVARATGEQLLFMNPDVIATVDDIRRLIDIKAAHPDIGIIAPKQVSPAGVPQKVFDDWPGVLNQSGIVKALQRWLLPRTTLDPRAEYTELTYCDWVTGSVLLIDRDDFDAAGGWCEDYWMYVEDADLCRMVFNNGKRIAYTPEVEVVHAHGGSSKLNVEVRAMTKTEVIISKHVYMHRHMRGLRRFAAHTMIVITRLLPLVVFSLLDLLTLGRIPTLRVRSKMLARLAGYYRGRIRTGCWLSPRALERDH
ncbi:MAG: glycosyltransferase family 2 protein [Woeseiaceae bacterium]|nr:glycosyltransferase family 2 protein [Woeseiaceae bacterium]